MHQGWHAAVWEIVGTKRGIPRGKRYKLGDRVPARTRNTNVIPVGKTISKKAESGGVR